MKKGLKIFSVVVFFLAVLLAAPFLIPQETYKKWFVSQVESQLPLDLEIKTFRLKFFPWPGLHLGGVQAATTGESFKNQKLLAVGSLNAEIELKPLFSKQILFHLELDRPELFFRTTPQGKTNWDPIFQALPKEERKIKSDWQMIVVAFKTSQATLSTPSQTVKALDFSIANLGFQGKSDIPLTLACAFLSEKQNFKVRGNFNWDADRQNLVTQNLKMTLGNITATLKGKLVLKGPYLNLALAAETKTLSGPAIRENFPELLNKFSIPENQVPDIKKINGGGDLTWSPKGLSLTASLNAQTLEYGAYPFQNVVLDIDYQNARLSIKKLSGELFEAKASGHGDIFFHKPISYHFDLDVGKVDLAKLAFLKKQMLGIGSVRGSLFGDIVDKKKMGESLNGQGEIRVLEGEIPSLKIGEEVFGSPVWDLLRPLVGFNKEIFQSLKALDAKVENLSIPFQIEKGWVHILNGVWRHPRYQIDWDGAISIDRVLSGKGVFVLPSNELEALVKMEAVRNVLANSSGEMELPFLLEGTFENPRFKPDKKILVPKFTRAVAAASGINIKDELKKGLQKILKPLQDIVR